MRGTIAIESSSPSRKMCGCRGDEGILKSHSLSSLLNFLRAFGDGPVAGVSGGQGIESWLACLEFEPVPQKTRRVGQRCTLNLSRAEMSSRWCGVVVRRGVPAQVSPSSFDHFSKLRGPSLKALVKLNIATLIFTHLATDLVILNHGQVTRMTLEHHFLTRRIFSGAGVEFMTRQLRVRYFDH
ncbi:hypothetical protein TNCV_126591 [Trichonephila clavipes]|nr:hypothetical protein TNCV_126591 [Trichonephila clavipes]